MSSPMRRGISAVTTDSLMVRGGSAGAGILISIVQTLAKHPSPNRNMFLVGVGWIFDFAASL